MPKVARVGVDTVGGGVINGPGASTVLVNGSVVSVKGDTIAPHGPGPHVAATITTASNTVFAEGKAVVRIGDQASCGHSVQSGSDTVLAG